MLIAAVLAVSALSLTSGISTVPSNALEHPGRPVSWDAIQQENTSATNRVSTDDEPSQGSVTEQVSNDDGPSQNFIVVEPPPVATQTSLPSVGNVDLPHVADSTYSVDTDSIYSSILRTLSRQGTSEKQEHAEENLNLAALGNHHAANDITLTRPHAGGAPESVSFGIIAKGFFGADLKRHNFEVDSVLYLKWKDSRTTAMVPSGMTSLTLSGMQAMNNIWTPKVAITNRDNQKYEVISTSVTISRTGDVTKIERASVTCNNVFDLEDYPFDEQSFAIKVASDTYMLNELVLTPDEKASGVRDGIFKGFAYELDSWEARAYEDSDAALKKSRGVLEIRATRRIDKYESNHLIPTMLLLTLSCGVSWLPFQREFITSRLALSIIALLTFTIIAIKSSGELPQGSPVNWNDVLNQQVQFLMFCSILLNIFAQVCKDQFKLEDLSLQIDREAKFVMPGLSIFTIVIVLTAGTFKWLTVPAAQMVTKATIIAIMALYIGCSMSSFNLAYAEKEEEDVEKASQVRDKQLMMQRVGINDQSSLER